MIRQSAVVLRVKMQKRLVQYFKLVYPHFRRRKGMHPSNYANTFPVCDRTKHNILSFLSASYGILPFYFNIFKLSVKIIRHFSTIDCNSIQCLLAVEILTSRYKIKLFHSILHSAALRRHKY